jgi:hypothetical protein
MQFSQFTLGQRRNVFLILSHQLIILINAFHISIDSVYEEINFFVDSVSGN